MPACRRCGARTTRGSVSIPGYLRPVETTDCTRCGWTWNFETGLGGKCGNPNCEAFGHAPCDPTEEWGP